MPVELDKKDLAKYPFLKEAQQLVSESGYSIDSLINKKHFIVKKGAERVEKAIKFDYFFDDIRLEMAEWEILSYAFARILISCLNERNLTDRLCRYEAERASYFLQTEDPEKRDYVASIVGINPGIEEISVVEYVGLCPALHDSKWRLINRDINSGLVRIEKSEYDELIKEKIRSMLDDQLPLRVGEGICSLLSFLTEGISAGYQEMLMEQFGEVDEGSFPPCMKAIINAVTEGTNIPHTARFSLTAFMHIIGMDVHQIVEVYTRAPDFDVEKTMYQVEHISGRGGTEYTPPTCATMKTYGLCVNRDSYCKKISHPLSYYKFKKKMMKRDEAPAPSGKQDIPEKPVEKNS